MAVDELQEQMERHNVPITNGTAAYLTIPAGETTVNSVDSLVGTLHYPSDLVDVRSVSERLAGSNSGFTPLTKHDFLTPRTLATELIDYAWMGQELKFIGATTDREIKIDYIQELIHKVSTSADVIGIIGARSYLGFKTAEFCSKYVAEDEARAAISANDAEGCLDNILGIAVKGQQNIATRRRPFRASMKTRRWM